MLHKYVPFFSFEQGVLFFFLILLGVLSGEHCAAREVRKIEELRDPSAHGNDSLPSCATSWTLTCLTWISEADNFSRYSQSAMSKSLDHPLSSMSCTSPEDSGTHLVSAVGLAMQPDIPLH